MVQWTSTLQFETKRKTREAKLEKALCTELHWEQSISMDSYGWTSNFYGIRIVCLKKALLRKKGHRRQLREKAH